MGTAFLAYDSRSAPLFFSEVRCARRRFRQINRDYRNVAKCTEFHCPQLIEELNLAKGLECVSNSDRSNNYRMSMRTKMITMIKSNPTPPLG
jgi:hypothetical protein